MKIIEVKGEPREVGRATGEALREDIRKHLSMPCNERERPLWKRRRPVFERVMEETLPEVLEEIRGVSEGADVPYDALLRLNIPAYADDLNVGEGCTNVAFSEGPDGPLLGKNNDGLSRQQQRPICCRRITFPDRIPAVVFSFSGMVAVLDGMNAEGLALEHSSVGSVYQQSDSHVPIRLWGYRGMTSCRTTAEFHRHMISRPMRGKGYSILCVDREGTLRSFEAPCPLWQVRKPPSDVSFMNCVNCYQLPMLAEADKRSEEGKQNALSRVRFFEDQLRGKTGFDLGRMKSLLQHHDAPSICRHGQPDRGVTNYSYICMPAAAKILTVPGNPCKGHYAEVPL
ncbi:MAG: C45 family autoproteolytic acyltransferase/hydrolase [Candidatus Brocadiia bacterium]